MKIAVVGAGQGGLYFSSLIKQIDPHAEITVWERNAPDDTFGFGVVFSDQTLSGIKASDQSVFEDMGRSFAYLDDVDVDIDGSKFTIGGNGFAAMSRKELLHVLQRRAKAHGVPVHFNSEAPPVEELMANYDLVLASDGINSGIRSTFESDFGTTIDPRQCKFMWLGTDLVFEAFEFFIRNTPYGVMQIHAYPMDDKGSTFIIEMHEDEITPNQNVMIHDDLLATGGTADAAAKLIKKVGGNVAGFSFVIGLDFLGGQNRLEQHSKKIVTLVNY